jgi:hypothetical protein
MTEVYVFLEVGAKYLNTTYMSYKCMELTHSITSLFKAF